ncbi:DMT family transporter [Hydrocarboniphaga sp.]|uniref:DMT family transporter n=1 Tax=Hydrocarboniphaga sp. TaxID=2033016 RepID=UPI003D0B9BFF
MELSIPPITDPGRRRGVLMMLLAVGLLSLMDGGLKLLTAHYPPAQVAFLRGAASLPFVLVWIARSQGFAPLLKVRWPLHLLRGVIGVGMITAFAYALRSLPLSTAYTLFFVAPLIITALSGPMLGERVGVHRWIAIVAGFGGTLVVLRPSGDGLFSWPALAVLVAASGYALSAITVRLLGRTDSSQSMVFWLLVSMSIGAGALAAPGWVPIAREHAPLIVGVGLCGALGQWAITEAFARAQASVIAPLEYSALAWGLLLDLLLWQALPDRWTLLGGTIIVASGLYLIRREKAPDVVVP